MAHTYAVRIIYYKIVKFKMNLFFTKEGRNVIRIIVDKVCFIEIFTIIAFFFSFRSLLNGFFLKFIGSERLNALCLLELKYMKFTFVKTSGYKSYFDTI